MFSITGGGAASPPISGTGLSVTASAPLLDLTQTWNSGGVTFTGLKANFTDTASAAASLLMDLQVGGATKFSVSKAGVILVGNGSAAAPSISFASAPAYGYYFNPATGAVFVHNGATVFGLKSNQAFFSAGAGVHFGSTDVSSASDASITRIAAGVLAIRLGTTADIASLVHTDFVVANATGSTLAVSALGKIHTNEGATGEVNLVLPSAVANMSITFVCQDADGIKATAATGDTIRIGGSVSAAAGNVASTTIGSVVDLVAINATEWIAKYSSGTWVVT
jgi:hypothetical protein